MPATIPLGPALEAIANEALRERGHANVFLVGRAGVGKSTLVNTVFDGHLARVGQGRPVTRQTRVYTRPGMPLSLYDTRGLEMGEFKAILADQERFIDETNRDSDANRHIHVGWVCIPEDLRRVEDAEIEMARMLASHMPVIAVITKARADCGFRNAVRDLLPQARAVIRVRALREELDDGHSLEPLGLDDLVAATCDLFPEGQRLAFVAAQKVDLELKRQAARGIVTRHALYALGNAANPLPFADQAGLGMVFVSMFAGVSAAYGLSPSAQMLSAFLAGAVGTPATSLTAALFAASLVKFIPVIGTVVGQGINAAVGPLATTTIGMAYVELLYRLYVRHAGASPAATDVVKALCDDFGSLVTGQDAECAGVATTMLMSARGRRRRRPRGGRSGSESVRRRRAGQHTGA
jgi:uncharacterized protein (DUF697 family)